jgi:hypothetical protein
MIHHYGLPLNPRERSRYESLSREITDLRRQLQPLLNGGRPSRKWHRDPNLTLAAPEVGSQDQEAARRCSQREYPRPR